MKTKNIYQFSVGIISLLMAAVIVAGCSTPATRSAKNTAAPEPKIAPSGAQLWSESCQHCHNFRSPGTYNDAQWEVIMLHMRVRANLTAVESQKVLEFLKSAN